MIGGRTSISWKGTRVKAKRPPLWDLTPRCSCSIVPTRSSSTLKVSTSWICEISLHSVVARWSRSENHLRDLLIKNQRAFKASRVKTEIRRLEDNMAIHTRRTVLHQKDKIPVTSTANLAPPLNKGLPNSNHYLGFLSPLTTLSRLMSLQASCDWYPTE